MLRRIKDDRWLLLAVVVLFLLPLPKFLAVNGLLPESAGAWPPTHYLQRGTDIFIWMVFALSYDLLIGYTGIVSFGHSLFLALGAYSIATGVMKLGLAFPAAILIGLLLSALVAAVVGLLSLRLKGHGFAMITLAFAEVAHVTALKLSQWTGGEDGLSVRVPLWLANRTNDYFVGLALVVVAFLLVRRITRSPFGRVLEAIRENEHRAMALGYNVTAYKVGAMTIAGVAGGLAGVSMAIVDTRFAISSLSTAGPTIEVMLMTILGGAGTLIGPMLGAAVVRLLAYLLPGLADMSPIFQRWQLLLGIIYIGTVMFLPYGIVGTYRSRVKRSLERLLPSSRKAA